MKVLWFSNIELKDDLRDTGSWIYSMANAFNNDDSVEINVISEGNVTNVTRRNYHSINQWLVPFEKLKSDGLPCPGTISAIKNIYNEINPDIIHIWGTENYWGLLTARGLIKGKTILEIQGLRSVIAKYFYSGMTFLDVLKCLGCREFLHPSVSLPGMKKQFLRWGKYETEMLLKHNFISTQSEWVRAHIRNINPGAHILQNAIILRPEFLQVGKWDLRKCVRYSIITYASSTASYKGLHILLEAVFLLRSKFPDLTLHIIGSIKGNKNQTGFQKWINKNILRLELQRHIRWLGSLNGKELVEELYKSNVAVFPSFVESYSLALEEALSLGIPSVVSFSGAMSELGIHEKTALFFSPGDSVMCANAIERLFTDPGLADTLSTASYLAKKEKNFRNNYLIQKAIYSDLLNAR